MPTSAWSPAVTGAQAAAGQLNQLLGTHPATLIYEGSAVATGNTVAQASTQSTYGNWVAQPFVLSTGTAVNRIRLWLSDAGSGADITVSLRADATGNPATSAIVSCVIPQEFLSATARWVEVPLSASGLTNGATYWIVVAAAGTGTNYAMVGCSGAVTPLLKTSANGTTWAAGTTQALFTVWAGTAGHLIGAIEDPQTGSTPHSRWTELTYDGSYNLINVWEYVGVFRNTRTLTYASGALTAVA